METIRRWWAVAGSDPVWWALLPAVLAFAAWALMMKAISHTGAALSVVLLSVSWAAEHVSEWPSHWLWSKMRPRMLAREHEHDALRDKGGAK